MYYKEYLRARGLLLKFAIVAGVLIILVLLFTAPPLAVASTAASQLTTVPSHDSVTTNVEVPGIEVHNVSHGAPLGLLFALAGFAASIFGMILGTSLSCENHGHLDLAWTRPTSRAGYAVRVMGVDLLAILTAFAFSMGLVALVITIRGWWPYVHAEPSLPLTVIRFALYPIAWYAVIAAITASMRGNAGIAVGLTWVANALLFAGLTINLPPLLHSAVMFVMYFTPLSYGTWSDSSQTNEALRLLVSTPFAAIGGLIGLSVLGAGAAVLQWRRLEA
jgi:hypothetical protein